MDINIQLVQLLDEPKALLTPTFAFLAILLTFLYFSLTWATNRMKDWEALKPESRLRGHPGIVCWISAVGCTTIAILGTHFFGTLNFVLKTRIGFLEVLAALSALLYMLYLWAALLKLFHLYYKNLGNLQPFTSAMADFLDYRKAFTANVLAITIFGWLAYYECLFGNFLAGVMGICFFFLAVANLGCHISLSGDQFPRCIESRRQEKEPSA